MNRREFVTLAGVGGAIACLPEIVSAETANFVAVGTVKELDKTGKLLVKDTPVGKVLIIAIARKVRTQQSEEQTPWHLANYQSHVSVCECDF